MLLWTLGPRLIYISSVVSPLLIKSNSSRTIAPSTISFPAILASLASTTPPTASPLSFPFPFSPFRDSDRHGVPHHNICDLWTRLLAPMHGFTLSSAPAADEVPLALHSQTHKRPPRSVHSPRRDSFPHAAGSACPLGMVWVWCTSQSFNHCDVHHICTM